MDISSTQLLKMMKQERELQQKTAEAIGLPKGAMEVGLQRAEELILELQDAEVEKMGNYFYPTPLRDGEKDDQETRDDIQIDYIQEKKLF